MSRAVSLALVAQLALVATAFAQDRNGADTPSDWAASHYKEFGIWKSVCDERDEDGTLAQRCYIRYADVFSQAPRFAAVFMFVFQKDRKTAIQYAFEQGTVYENDGLRIDRDGQTVWTASEECRQGPNCLMTEPQTVSSTLEAFSGGGELVQNFTDRHGSPRKLRWDLTGFEQALADYREQSTQRNLLD